MTVLTPALLVVAVVVTAGLAAFYAVLDRRRGRALAAAGLASARRPLRHLPAAFAIVGIGLLLAASARPQAVVAVPHAAGTVILAFDTSASMAATDIDPSRLEAAKEAAAEFIDAQPDTVDIGVVAFAEGALTTLQPTSDRADALAAVDRLTTAGSTSVGQAVLTALGAITGTTVELPAEGESSPDLGYWGSATIVLFSDGEETAKPDAASAAVLAADAGIHIETIGVGTTSGTTIESDGYTVATALDEELLTEVAETTAGSYHALSDVSEIADVASSVDLRLTVADEETEITALLGLAGLLLLCAAGWLMIVRTGRII